MPRSTTRRRILTALLIPAVRFTTAGILFAHDFWIVPDAFQIAPGGSLDVRGQTGTTFPISQSAVAPERVAEARLVGASSDEPLGDLTISGKSLLIRHRPTTSGQRIVAVALMSRSARTTPERLQRYIALEGAPELAERYAREGGYPTTDSVTQISVKFAKTIVEVGRGGPRAFTKVVGHGLELVPVNDPAKLRLSDTLRVRLLYHGQPVAAAHLHAGAAPAGITAQSDSAQAAGRKPKDVVAETGRDGVALIPLAEPGIWNVRTLHGSPAPASPGTDPGAWEVFFATLVFGVGTRD